MVEVWLPCVGFENLYAVSNLGRVLSLRNNIVLKSPAASHGYPSVNLGENRVRTVHSLVLEAHRGLCPEGMEACHGNGIKRDNRLDNLRWDYPKANGADKIAHGTAKVGGVKAAATKRERLNMQGFHSVEEMARTGCTSARGIRWWEEKGLLGDVARSAGDTRRYTPAQMDRARIIAAAQFGGFDLETVKAMVEAYDTEAHSAILTRLSDQVRAAARLGENLPSPPPIALEYDL